jgi:dolichyl-phosphate-mannose-protein mannosyltransferase
MDVKDLSLLHLNDTQSLQCLRFVSPVRKLRSVFDNSTALSVTFVAAVLVVARLAPLIGVTTPEKFYFDEAHYVPAAREMLEPVLPSLLLNPMHPPLAKELMAVSIRVFGDVPLGWRYPSVLFGSLAIVEMYLCGLVLFTA